MLTSTWSKQFIECLDKHVLIRWMSIMVGRTSDGEIDTKEKRRLIMEIVQ